MVSTYMQQKQVSPLGITDWVPSRAVTWDDVRMLAVFNDKEYSVSDTALMDICVPLDM